MEPEQTKSKWSVIERYRKHLAIAGWTFQRKRPPGLLLFSYHPRDSANGKYSDGSLHVRDWGKRFSYPEESKLVEGRRKNIKNGDPHRKRDLS